MAPKWPRIFQFLCAEIAASVQGIQCLPAPRRDFAVRQLQVAACTERAGRIVIAAVLGAAQRIIIKGAQAGGVGESVVQRAPAYDRLFPGRCAGRAGRHRGIDDLAMRRGCRGWRRACRRHGGLVGAVGGRRHPVQGGERGDAQERGAQPEWMNAHGGLPVSQRGG
jgi:hypothetical protein